jgi:hypothetical protein
MAGRGAGGVGGGMKNPGSSSATMRAGAGTGAAVAGIAGCVGPGATAGAGAGAIGAAGGTGAAGVGAGIVVAAGGGAAEAAAAGAETTGAVVDLGWTLFGRGGRLIIPINDQASASGMQINASSPQ